jgi:protease I
MRDITGKQILILATDGFEQSELEVPRRRLIAAGATITVAAPHKGEIKGWENHNWSPHPVAVDIVLKKVTVEDYDALLLPGGQMNPDTLRGIPEAVKLVRDFYDQNKIVAAVCHAPWLLIEAGVADGLKATSFKTVRTDLINAGADWQDEQVVVDDGVITSRNPGDLEAFSEKIAEELAEGRHLHRHAA